MRATRDSVPVRLPPDRIDFAAAQADAWIEWLARTGVDVVGDPEDLRPVPPDPDTPWRNPDRVSAKLQLGAALDALTVMTREAAERTDAETPVRRLRDQARRLRER